MWVNISQKEPKTSTSTTKQVEAVSTGVVSESANNNLPIANDKNVTPNNTVNASKENTTRESGEIIQQDSNQATTNSVSAKISKWKEYFLQVPL